MSTLIDFFLSAQEHVNMAKIVEVWVLSCEQSQDFASTPLSKVSHHACLDGGPS